MIKLELNSTHIKLESCPSGTTAAATSEEVVIYRKDKSPLMRIAAEKSGGSCRITLICDYKNVYGMGERFDCVRRQSRSTKVEVIENFCNQGAATYCPMPFFFTDSGFGIFADTMAVSDFEFADGRITVTVRENSAGALPPLVIFTGEPAEILSEFSHYTGEVKLPPKWAFGIWASANKWNSEDDVDMLLENIDREGLPHNVVVLEAWSDECTFYNWNGGGKWRDPAKMVGRLHERNMKLILWQIPVLKLLTPDLESEQHDKDCAFARSEGLCVKRSDGTPYVIAEGNWFGGSVIPDFTNKKTVDWWFEKRQHLLDMGVDGFKTDGGEFIYGDDAHFADGSTSIEMKNGYAQSYIKAYNDFIGADRVLFSRAGYTGQQAFPIQWAGDQQSTWSEFRAVLTAGLSAGLSGIVFWSYDIGGFAGALPSVELYERSTQMAVFCPVMQWHSESPGGQFAELMPSAGGNNERSPWNIAAVYKDDGLIERLRFHYNLRTNLMPYLYLQAAESAKAGLPMLRHPVLEYPNDTAIAECDDEFMLGDLLVAPILAAGETSRRVYLPAGEWLDFYSGEKFSGGWHDYNCGSERIPVFLRKGGVVALNLGEDLTLGSYVGSDLDSYKKLCFFVTEERGSYNFFDDLGNDFTVSWADNAHGIQGECGVPVKVIVM